MVGLFSIGYKSLLECKQVPLQGMTFTTLQTPIQQDKYKTFSIASYKNEGVKQALKTKVVLQTNMQANGETFGALKDSHDNFIYFNDGSKYVCNGTNGVAGAGLDHVYVIKDQNKKLDKRYMISQFECGIGAMYRHDIINDDLDIDKDSMQFISQKDYHGGWVHCAGSVTPWQTALGSEEYEIDAKTLKGVYYQQSALYFQGDLSKSNPYYWGWVPEVSVVNEQTKYVKHYSMGRFSHELAYVMPDQKTVYLSDDGTNVGLYMFIATRKADLSEGTLYAAKWHQQNAKKAKASIEWISLGTVNDQEIKQIVDSKPFFSDLFDIEPFSKNNCSTKGFKAINTSFGAECVRPKKGVNYKVLSRLETRRYAAYLGATTEFRKEEGITYDKQHDKLYIGMSELGRGMEDGFSKAKNSNKYDIQGNNDIRLPYNKCGAVFEADFNPSTLFGSNYVINSMQTLIQGTPKTYAKDSDFEGNSCDVNALANPDNVSYLEGTNILAIGEDTTKHLNNVVWLYNVDTKALTRAMTGSQGAEMTSVYWIDVSKHKSFLTSVVQHPGVFDENSPHTPNSENYESTLMLMGPFIH